MNKILIEALKISSVEMVTLVGILILVGFILGMIERQSNQYMQIAWGRKGVLMTAWLGTPVHEIGHAIMCIIFRHQITDIRLLITDSSDGTMGYVQHNYNPTSIYQSIGNFFIGIAPIFSGISAIFLSMYFLIPKSFQAFNVYLKFGINNQVMNANYIKKLMDTSFVLTKNIFSSENLISYKFWIFILITICISSHIALSKADMKGATSGLVTLLVTLFIVNLVAPSLHINTYRVISWLTKYNAYVITLSITAIIFSLITLGISYLSFLLKVNKTI